MRLKPDMASFKCDYCQSVYFPDKNDDGVRVLDEPSGQNCPVCNSVPLVRAVLAKVPIIYCTGCHGMMVAMQALEGLVDQLRAGQGSEGASAAPDTEDLHRKINCPQCHHPMDAHFYAGPGNAVINSCENCCLIWMDRGVLMRIVHASDASHQSENSFSEDSDPPPDQDWSPMVNRSTSDAIVDGVIDSFFK
jgi:Zn-finger nucleic acid-binding protein